MSASEEIVKDVFGATLTRSRFVKGAGALVVGLSLPVALTAESASAAGADLDPSQLASWIEIHADNTILYRTGKAEMGQGSAAGAYAQIVAEELNVPYSSITKAVLADTGETPDGGLAAGFLMKRPGEKQSEAFGGGMLNLQRVAAYTYQALLSLASTQLGVPVGSLTAKDGVISGGGKSVTYSQLVSSGQFSLKIPTTGTAYANTLVVTGGVPTKPVSQYTVIGTSQPNLEIPGIVNATSPFVADIRLPGMLHARIVRPATLGSTLVSVGKLDKKAFPTSQVVVRGNLVGVLSPNEWEAIGAAANVAGTTKWTNWAGLPGSSNLVGALRKIDYTYVPTTVGGYDPETGGNTFKGNADTAFTSAAKTLSQTYFAPYVKHAPIGPSISLADVQSNGAVHLWVHGQYTQGVRNHIATMLGIDPSMVYVHWAVGSGHYGRSNGGNEGSEADAVILSQAVGKPVRVTWMRQEDFQWSLNHQGMLMDIKAGLDSGGNMTALKADYYGLGSQDNRPSGALLARLPAGPPAPIVTGISNEWPYDVVPNVNERGHGSGQLGESSSPNQIGLSAHSMRTPTHRQENFAVESMVNEAAAAAGVDPIQYRLRHTTAQRLITVLNTLKTDHGWETRPSPSPHATATGSTPVSGQGMMVLRRFNAVWAAAINIDVTPQTGKIKVTKYTAVVDPGIAVNPGQLTRMSLGGMVMGISEALHEEMTFDTGKITSFDWVTYPIMRFTELPDLANIKVVIINNPSVNAAGMGGEAPNSFAPAAIAAAFFDATGKYARSYPMRPAIVRAWLKA
jgi:CO/xanthine dehydrogenase Mo-binding subunit